MSRIVDKVKKPAVNVSFHASGNWHITVYGETFRMKISANYPDDWDTSQYISWELKEGESWDMDGEEL